MIRTFGLTKRYGDVLALDDLTLEVGEGEIFGYIGPNGAGKTTTLKILATLLAPTSGRAQVCGYEVGRESTKIRPLIGYMPDFFGVYEDMTVAEYLTFFAAAYGLRGNRRTRILNEVLELTDLGSKRDTIVEALSRGMQQRLGLARTLVHDPKVLILDEPASGLDPRARIEIRELLKEVKRMGKTIIISSHILSELAQLCDAVGIRKPRGTETQDGHRQRPGSAGERADGGSGSTPALPPKHRRGDHPRRPPARHPHPRGRGPQFRRRIPDYQRLPPDLPPRRGGQTRRHLHEGHRRHRVVAPPNPLL